MFIDARTLSEDTVIESEVCIIGAGPAGTTLAREFIGQDCRVCLLRVGELNLIRTLSRFCEGKIIEELLKIFINRSVAWRRSQPMERSNR